MDKSTQVLLFGDQTSPFVASLRRLLSIKHNALLTTFFERVFFALRAEVNRLPISFQDQFPRFTSLLDLLARTEESKTRNPALESAFHTLNQLASFVSHYGQSTQKYPSPVESHIVGVCTGLLSSAAISTSQTWAELFPAAIEVVLLAFRTGIRTTQVRNDIEQPSAGAQSWSMIVPLTAQRASMALDAFEEDHGIPHASRPYLSSITPNNVTISGPPSVLKALIKTSPFSESKAVKVSVYAPYHTSHLYSEPDVDAILASSSPDILNSYKPKIPVFSDVTGEIINAATFGDLLRIAIREILMEPIRWDKLLEGTAAELKNAGITQATIMPFMANGSQHLAAAISQAGIPSVKIDAENTDVNAQPHARAQQSKIAIVGFSGRFPDAASTTKFWEILHLGKDVHREIPKDRFDVDAHYDPTGKKKNTSRVRHGCFIEEPGLFDARFFNMSPREAANADPGQRLAITTAYEAFEMAGFVPNRTASTQRDRVGIFYGMTSDDWREVNSGQNVDTYFIPGGNRAFTPGRINYHFKFSGPSFSVDTACSSSFAAIHTACNSLWRGDCDTAIAGGTNVMTNPDNFAGLDRGHFLSTTGNCNTFDDAANGYCRADAVGTVILKRLEDAEADCDPIYGVMLGAYTNHSAEAESMTRPHSGAQAFIFNKMLSHANVNPEDISYIEMHGTGTQAGDAVEMGSVLQVFAPKEGARPTKTLHLGSAKANIGHAESASGVASLIKVLMMMKNNEIPPHCGIKTKINHNFPDLAARNVHIARVPTKWTRPAGGKRTVFMNNFSAAGGNTALLMEDAPIAYSAANTDPRSTHMVAISGRSIVSLKNNLNSFAAFLEKNPDTSLPSLSYTTTARRMHHNHRVVVSGANIEQVTKKIRDSAQRQDLKPVPAKIPNVAFAFTGQGVLQSGMGKQLFENFVQFKNDIQRFDRIGQSHGFPSIQPLIDGSIKDVDNVSPVIAQLGTTCMQMALTRLWASWGVTPAAVVGHSLGEYAALNAAGVLSASDTIYLTGKRAQLLVARCSMGTHSMLAVQTSLAQVGTHLVGKLCEVACINGPNALVLSGSNECIDSLAEELSTSKFKSTKLKVPYAFHSAQVEAILAEFEEVAKNIRFSTPAVPFISPLLGEVVEGEGVLNHLYLSRACRETVDFASGLNSALESKTITEKTLWVELGSHPVCSGMIKSVIGSDTIALPSLQKNKDTFEVLATSLSGLHLGGIEVNWNEYHRDFKSSHRVIELPAYNWDAKTYWIQYNNNFCLTKGDSPAPVQAALPAPVQSKLSTSSVQKTIEEHLGAAKPSIVMESDVQDPTLVASIMGHAVNGTPLCPSSLYADIALTLGDYLINNSKTKPSATAMDVADMVVKNPLIATGQKQLFRSSAVADWSAKEIVVSIYSVNEQGKKTTDHANCKVKLGDADSWMADWKRNSYLIRSRIDALHRGVDNGATNLIKRGMAYKLFGAIVNYDQQYKGMEEIVMNSDDLETSTRVKFQQDPTNGKYYLAPFWIDSLGQVTGFTMNANDNIDSKTQVFVNHGWDSLRVATKLSADKTYETYVKMQNVGGTMHAGDVYIFDGDTIVAMYGGVKFQGVPRRILDHLLPGAGKPALKADATATPKPITKSAPVTAAAVSAKLQAKPVKAPVPSPAPALRASGPSIAEKALIIICDEVGVSISDLVPSASFADFGVDSLLSLNISSRLREELELDVESSLFNDCPTVKDFLAFLPKSTNPQDVVIVSEISSSYASTPASESEAGDSQSTSGGSIEDDDVGIIASIRRILAEEIGVKEAEITGTLDLSELGMDSLLSLNVLGRLREEHSMDLPSDLFVSNSCLNAIEVTLGIKSKSAPTPALAQVDNSQLDTASVIVKELSIPLKTAPNLPRASSILLQGSSKTAIKHLFLFPDGSGSSTSYATLPRIAPDVAVYGLNCPFMKTPQDMKCGLADLTTPYLDEIRRRQPHGPYFLGGWSAGGICAYDAAQVLTRAGEKVERLILLDTPNPIGLEKLPTRLYDYFNSINLFGQGNAPPPSWLLPHFLAFIDALDMYKAQPFPGEAPQVHVIWAQDGVCKDGKVPRPEERADDPREMKWLLNNRTDLGPNGWDTLVGGSKIKITSMKDANHFTMMEGGKAKELSQFIAGAML
ncbi:conidial yellow pigment biosynthesis polyketide synthase [Melanomma pulvis-pyrius CBS 109.77]|uniref:Conidial yellow pigment biosynthesis polyketide synthase n=1 Tax=Melanomma pulvis-pyrius CBS 109.77 TaxID=1314802 RepID=A0A6A6X242_9PLEO|nr:conidial yellow pigment biosynthesis polyketide synthase [Melanomma pulvis-pyrius CBS 109.77]